MTIRKIPEEGTLRANIPHERYVFVNRRFHCSSGGNILPTDVGSRIGITYVVNGSTAEMHFIYNGEDQGVSGAKIPYNNEPLWVVVDVYGTTKKVRIVQLSGGRYFILFLRIDGERC